jgi:hypothetical protein
MAKKRRSLTRRERKFLKHRAAGLTLEKAAIAAGYSPKSAAQAGDQAMQRIQIKAPELFARHELDDDSYIEKHVKPLLFATEVKVFNYNGKLIYSKPLAALAIRARVVELIAELKGMKVKEQETPRNPIKVVMIDAAHRPPRPPSAPTLNLPSMPNPAHS